MRYRWIELQGYGGIYNGMGLTQIKIDFDKCKTNKIVIRGSNGSGKSTIMNAISPNPDNNDCFMPGVEARKNICMVDGQTEYVIRYIHPVTNSGRGTTKGYISKTINGQLVELNPNGNISSCKDLIYEELKMDSSFISLSNLSSENRGLVDNKPAERKKLVNSIISTLDTYNGIYKKLSKQSSVLKQMVNSITYKIDRLGNNVQLNAKLQNIEARLKTLEEERDKTVEAIAVVKLRISDLMAVLKYNNYDSVVSELKEVSAHNKALRTRIQKKMDELGIKSIDDIEAFCIYLDKQIAVLESDIDSMRSQVNSLLVQRENEYKQLEAKRAKFNSLQSEHSYLDIKNAVNTARESVTKYEGVFVQMGLMNINLITKAEFDSAMEALHALKQLAGNLTANWQIADIKYVIENRSDVAEEQVSIEGLEKDIDAHKSMISEIETKLAILTSKQDLIAQLKNRPKDCTIDDCPYIKSAVEASIQYQYEDSVSYCNIIERFKTEIDDIENTILIYRNHGAILQAVTAIDKELRSNMRFIQKLPVAKDFEQMFYSRVLSMDPFRDIDELYKYVDCGNMLEKYKLALEQLREYESEYKVYEAKNDIIEAILVDIDSLTQRTDQLAQQIEDLNNSITSNQNKLTGLKSAKTKVGELLDSVKGDLKSSEDRESELIEIKQTLDVNSTEIHELQEQLNTLASNHGSVMNDINTLNEDKNDIKQALSLLTQYNEELKEYSDKYNKIEKIRYYSSPSTGIQTLFMQLYMNKIINTANSLLALLFEGEFVLQPFIINENEFRIPCLGSGLLHDDISSMSTAQKCMISMILSFSILHQSSTKYNILSIDEMDGGLDTNNRGFFIELLDRIMGMMHCEQCFIISHNNELNTASCDLIILKNNGNEVLQGNVIWQY